MKARLLLSVLIVTIITIIVLVLYGDRDMLSPAVIGLPADYNPDHSLGPYQGLHPSKISRPQESFDYPIRIGQVGPSQPLFAGPKQYPFWCRTQESGLGQPLVDNRDGVGVPVYLEDQRSEKVIGFSRDCLAPTRAWYFYKKKSKEEFGLWTEDASNIEIISVNGKDIEYIVRVEMGTINRFIYVIAVLKSPDEKIESPGNRLWNKRLVYYFGGGVGIGRRQGRINSVDFLKQHSDQLAKGYAVIHSTGNKTSNHYNIWLAEETALRVKQQFISLYGQPLYTVGVGGSGGAIQQYLIAQNNSDLLDAIIPLYSYPDMVTQTNYVFDCELLEYYFDVTDRNNPLWQTWENRRWIEGMNARSDVSNEYARIDALAHLMNGRWPRWKKGNSECAKSWRALTPLVLNPRYTMAHDRYSESIIDRIHWTYWDDLKHFYGMDEQGYARVSWDNVGVQYGLQALRDEHITPQQFIDLNARIGSWKPQAQLRPERHWYLGKTTGSKSSAGVFSLWGEHNMALSPDNGTTPAPRRRGDIKAMQAAYRSGQVFLGRINIPVIDARHYLEDELNMHHTMASFSTRARIVRSQGHADNQVIWISAKSYNPTTLAFEVMDEWMMNILNSTDQSVIKNKPDRARDTCFDVQGHVIAIGEHVWNGQWNQQPDGACMEAYPIYSTSRMVAGDGISGETFKCQLQSIDEAIRKGIYSPVDMRPYKQRLAEIFVRGVCDYSLPDAGRPDDI